MPKITQLLKPLGVPVFVGGHSLGGALAAVAALELAKAGVPVIAVYTFGMQRPGNAQLKADYDAALGATTYRLVYGGDIVPSVPPSFLGFRHVGRLLRGTRGTHFDSRDLSPDMSSDDPAFADGIAHNLFARFRAPFGDAGPAPLLDEVGPQWAGRPDAVKMLIRLLPQSIRDHIQDSYIAALT